MQTLLLAAVAAIVGGLMVLMFGGLVGNQSDDGFGGTRFPNGLSADGTSPSAGEVRGTTGTITGAATVGGTLAVTGATTLTGDVTMSGAVTMLEKSESISADNTITAAESGTTYYLNTTGATSTLPAVGTATGTVYRFVVASALATENAIIDSAEGDNIEGTLIVAGAVVDCAGEDSVQFITDGENVGDYVEFRSDGQNWLIGDSGVLTAAKMTCTDDGA